MQRTGSTFGLLPADAAEEGDAPTAIIKPSIAVLPFDAPRADQELQQIADRISIEIAAALSRCQSLFVTAARSSFVYRDRQVDSGLAGRELGVQHVLEGQLQRSANGIRLAWRVVEIVSGASLCADSLEVDADEIGSCRLKIVVRVLRALTAPDETEIARVMRALTSTSLTSNDLYSPGVATAQLTVLRLREALRRSIVKDDDLAAASAMLAYTFVVEQAISGMPCPPDARDEAVRLARRSIDFAGDDAFALAKAAHVLAYLGHEFDLANSLVEQALQQDPNLAEAWFSLGWVALMSGDPARSVGSFDMLLRLSPFDPARGLALNGRAFSLFLLGRYDEGRNSASKACQIRADAHSLCALAVNLVGLNQLDQARATIARIMQSSPNVTVATSMVAFPTRSQAHRDILRLALEAAGLPP
jgi:TolB-like protein